MKIRVLIDANASREQFHWRVDVPFKYITRYAKNDDVKIVTWDDDIPEDTDILVVPKLIVRYEGRTEAKNFFDEMRKSNTLLVYDTDDDTWSESYVEYITQLQWSKEKNTKEELLYIINELEERAKAALWTIEQCDAVTVSTEKLAERLRKRTDKPIFVIDNAIDVEGFEASLNPENTLVHPHYITIGCAGGSKPPEYLLPMLEAWNTLAASDNQIKFVITGWMPDLTGFSQLTEDKIIHIPWTDIDNYPNGMQVDIGCVCVSDTEFALCKSPIKAWEYSLAGALVIASNALYSSQPVPTCETASDWFKTLSWYVRNFEDREKMAESYNKFVKSQYDIKYNWLYWMDAYSKILNTVGKSNESNAVRV